MTGFEGCDADVDFVGWGIERRRGGRMMMAFLEDYEFVDKESRRKPNGVLADRTLYKAHGYIHSTD